MSELRKLPYGANYLDWDDLSELREAVAAKVLFRYQTTIESRATRLEQLACRLFNSSHALACHNCTEGLRLSLLATRPRVGDLVYIPAVTFVAVAGAVLSCGLIPVLVDVDEGFHLDPAKLPAGVDRLIVAHMEGSVGPVPAGVPYVIEDAAQAFGGRHPDGRYAGCVGTTGVFSFHHNKVLTSGEGGIIITNDAEIHERMRQYHDHGAMRVQGEYPFWTDQAIYGENCVTSETIAGVQLQQLRHYPTIHSSLERGYENLWEAIPHEGPFRPIPRRPGDMKISIRIEFETVDLRRVAEERLRACQLSYWTLERYFLPDHPVLTRRHSIYADGFPWNLATAQHPPRSSFDRTRERLSRVLCLTIGPELSEDAQKREAESYRRVLRQL